MSNIKHRVIGFRLRYNRAGRNATPVQSVTRPLLLSSRGGLSCFRSVAARPVCAGSVLHSKSAPGALSQRTTQHAPPTRYGNSSAWYDLGLLDRVWLGSGCQRWYSKPLANPSIHSLASASRRSSRVARSLVASRFRTVSLIILLARPTVQLVSSPGRLFRSPGWLSEQLTTAGIPDSVVGAFRIRSPFSVLLSSLAFHCVLCTLPSLLVPGSRLSSLPN